MHRAYHLTFYFNAQNLPKDLKAGWRAKYFDSYIVEAIPFVSSKFHRENFEFPRMSGCASSANHAKVILSVKKLRRSAVSGAWCLSAQIDHFDQSEQALHLRP